MFYKYLTVSRLGNSFKVKLLQNFIFFQIHHIVGNKATGKISKRTCAYQSVRNVCFSKILACFLLLKDSRFRLITDDILDISNTFETMITILNLFDSLPHNIEDKLILDSKFQVFHTRCMNLRYAYMKDDVWYRHTQLLAWLVYIFKIKNLFSKTQAKLKNFTINQLHS